MNEEFNIIYALQYAAGFKGSRIVGGTTKFDANFRAFEVNEDCVVSQILDDKGQNVLAELGLTGGQKATVGRYLALPGNRYFTSITLTSGSIAIYYI